MKNLYDYTREKLSEHLKKQGFKAFNARQIYEWVYKKKTLEFEAMSNLSKPLRSYLVSNMEIKSLKRFTKQKASDGTVKYLFALEDDYLIEAVLMRHAYGKSLCVTTQVGCNIGCSFCASGLKKKDRDLLVSEMVAQVMEVEALEDIRISHVVLMGTGEPFDNYENAMDFIDVINDPYGLEIGARHITVSTSGIVPKIYAFAKREKQVNLAISLHAHDDVTRTRLMPINKQYPIKDLIEAVKYYIKTTNRRVTFEYLLLGGVNDSLNDADALSNLLRGINAYVNLIPYNPVSEFDYKQSTKEKRNAFYKRLINRGINATLREEKGADIDAACGQLRINKEK